MPLTDAHSRYHLWLLDELTASKPTAATPTIASSASANLDLVRAVAVLCVFVAHLMDNLRGTISEATWHFGQMGVLIFFVHTSLVLMRSLERSPLDGAALVRDFYLRRAFRIYPLAIVVLTTAAVLQQWPLPDYLAHITLTQNLFYIPDRCCAIWTLPLEVQMYLALPLAFLLLRTASVWWLASCWVLAIGLGVIQPTISGRLNVLLYAPCFMAGIVAWWLSRRSSFRLPAWLFPVAFVATWPIWLLASREYHPWYRWAFTLALGLTLPWFRELTWRPLVRPALWVATYSYGIYLGHDPIQQWALTLPPWAVWPALVSVGVAVPILLYHAVEAPMIQTGRRLARQAVAHPVPARARAEERELIGRLLSLLLIAGAVSACGNPAGPSMPEATMAVVVVDGSYRPLLGIPVTFDPRYPITGRIKQTDASGTVSWRVPTGEAYVVIVNGVTRFGSIPVMGDCRWFVILNR